MIWISEAADLYPDVDPLNGINWIYRADAHQMWRPEHLPGGELARMSEDRHAGRLNVLFFDSSVQTIRRAETRLEMFDDGVTRRATSRLLENGSDSPAPPGGSLRLE